MSRIPVRRRFPERHSANAMSYEIPNGLQVEDMIEVRGRLHPDAHQILVELVTRETAESTPNAALASDDEKTEIPLKLVVNTSPGLTNFEKAGDWVAIGKTSAGTFSRRNRNNAELAELLYSGAEFTLRIVAFENRFEIYVEDILVLPFEYLIPLSEVSHLVLSGDVDFTALEFLDSHDFLTEIENKTYRPTQSTAEPEEPSASLELAPASAMVSMPVDLNANINVNASDEEEVDGGGGGEPHKKKLVGSGRSNTSSKDKSGGRVRVHSKTDRAPGGANYLKGLFEKPKPEGDAGVDADDEFDVSTFGPDPAEVDLTAAAPAPSWPSAQTTAYKAPTTTISAPYSKPSTQVNLPSGNTQKECSKPDHHSLTCPYCSPLGSKPKSTFTPKVTVTQPVVESTGPASGLRATVALPVTIAGSQAAAGPAAGPATGAKELVTYRVVSGGGIKDTDDAGSGVKRVTERVAPKGQVAGRVQVGVVKPVTDVIVPTPVGGDRLTSRVVLPGPAPVPASISVSMPPANGRVVVDSGVKVDSGKPEDEELEEGVVSKKAAIGVTRGAHPRANTAHVQGTAKASFDSPDVSGDGIVNFQNMGNVNSGPIEGECRVGRRLQAQGRFVGSARLGAGVNPEIERLYFALSSVSGRHLGDLPLGEVALVVLVQVAPRPLVVAYVVRGERFLQVVRKPHVPPAVLEIFKPGGHFVVVALVKYRRLQLFVNDEHLLDVPLARRTSSSSRVGSNAQQQYEKKVETPQTMHNHHQATVTANGKGATPDPDAQMEPSWFKFTSVWGDVAADPGPVYLLPNQLTLPFYDEIPESCFQADCPEMTLHLEFEPTWTKFRVSFLSDDIDGYNEDGDVIKPKVPTERLEFELEVGSRSGRIMFRHEKHGEEVHMEPVTGLDDLVGLRGPTNLTLRFTEEEYSVILNRAKRLAAWRNVGCKRLAYVQVEAGESSKRLFETQDSSGVKLKGLEWSPKSGASRAKSGLPCCPCPCIPIQCSIM